MEYKPWPLLILAFFHFIEPVTKVLFYSVYFHLNPLSVVVLEYQAATALQVFEYFFLFPIAGIAIFAVKKWSFPVFILVELWVLITNLPYLSELYQTQQGWLLSFFIFFGTLNIIVVSYLLLPAVRIAYLDPRIRWWEAKPRYTVSIECEINKQAAGTIRNISKSGVFIATNNELPINSEIHLDFTAISPLNKSRHFHIQINAIVLHKFKINNHEGYGIRYSTPDHKNRLLMNSMIKHFEKSNFERRPARRNIIDLLHWLRTLITTGRGLLPNRKTNPAARSDSSG